MTAEERGSEMMKIPIKDLPPLAVEFAKDLCRRIGGCGEVLLHSWTVYAQCVEGLECTDPFYAATDSDRLWFLTRGTTPATAVTT